MSIPIHLITGFLGSGKSTFLKYYLENSRLTGKIAIIQNEFSPVGIDGKKLSQTNDYEVLEINNGSVFCVCLLGSFIDSLSSFIDQVGPDLLLMEASGLTDTIGVGQVFQSGKLKGKCYLDHTWCLVDGLNYNRISSLMVRLHHQVRSANTVILNKTDLIGENVSSITTEIKRINPFARVVTAKFGEIELTEVRRAINIFPETSEKPLGRPDLESVVIRSNCGIKKDALTEFFLEISIDCFRCKGFVKLKDNKFVFVQGVFDDIKLEETPSFSGPSEVVLIGIFHKRESLQILYDEYCRK